MTSFDSSKLQATLSIVRNSPSEMYCVMIVDTSYQIITEWNEAYWRMEMDTLESWLLHHNKREAEWEEFNKQWRRAAVQWTRTVGRRGGKMPPQR
jgi:hypothetical protein